MEWAEVDVTCRSDFRYAQEPQAITWPDGRRQAVTRVLRAWRTPAGAAAGLSYMWMARK